MKGTPASGRRVRIGTRGSALALWQARRVAALLEDRLSLAAELVIIETSGDRDRVSPLDSLGEVGVFTKEIERALLEERIDVAVHSLKDLPTELPGGLALAALPERAAAHDVLVARAPLDALAPGARIGTSSRRRREELRAFRGDLVAEEIRGNVPTRVEKCRRGELDGVVLAAAGLERLGIDLDGRDRSSERGTGNGESGGVAPELAGVAGGGETGAPFAGINRSGDRAAVPLRAFELPIDRFVSAPGQGALALETRAGDAATFAPLGDPRVAAAVHAERGLLARIGGGCSVPLGAHARVLEDGRVELRARLFERVLGVDRDLPALVRASTPEGAATLALSVLRPDPGATAAVADGLSGRRIALLRGDPELEAALSAAGAVVIVEPATETIPIDPRPILAGARWVLVTSRNAVPALEGGRFERTGAVGPGTAQELAARGIAVDLLPGRADGAGLADAFIALGEPKGTPVVIAAARDGRKELRDRLERAGYNARTVEVYETRRLERALPAAEVTVFSSPRSLPREASALRGARAVAIGAATAESARRLGIEVTVAERPTPAGLVAAIQRALGRGQG